MLEILLDRPILFCLYVNQWFVTYRKTFDGRYPITSHSIAPKGRQIFDFRKRILKLLFFLIMT
jgi:hypothetical protein